MDKGEAGGCKTSGCAKYRGRLEAAARGEKRWVGLSWVEGAGSSLGKPNTLGSELGGDGAGRVEQRVGANGRGIHQR